MNSKIKWGLVAVMLIVGNEVLTWLILAILAVSFALPLAKEACERG